MNKALFLKALRERLSFFPQDDIEERISFYEEMIDDRIEEGMTEEEAIAAVGSVDEVVGQIMSEIPLSKLVARKVKPKRKLKAWEIVLLILGSPVWVPLVLAAIVALLSVYVVIWSIVICVYAANLSFAAGTVYSIPCAVQYLTMGKPAGAFFALGAGVAFAGFSILMFFASAWITKGVVRLTKKIFVWTKSLFIEKEDSDHARA